MSRRSDARAGAARPRKFILLFLVLSLVVALFLFFRLGPPVAIEISASRPGVGRMPTQVTIRLAEPSRGLGAIRIEALQEDREVLLAERGHRPRPVWSFWGERTAEDEVIVEVGPEIVPGLKEGELTLRVSAERAPALGRRPPASVAESTLPVRLRPPSLAVLSSQHFAAQGGSGIVIYRIAETAMEDGGRDGVQAGDWFFQGLPLPGGQAGERMSLYGIPYVLDDPARLRLVATDGLGNESTAAFLDRFFPRPLTTDTIRISDDFLERVVPAVLAQTPEIGDRGDLLANYLAINGELRRANAATLIELGTSSRPLQLWQGRFLQLPSSKVTSSFADRRTYVYGGEEVDRQDHLGFDLASFKHAPVPAAGAGVVVLAGYFGIYGNTVVLDHGQGLMSLYSHLSSLSVAEGQEVEKAQELGRTGVTGLAGGDHLHFTMLIRGLAVTPLEWWDEKWIRDRIISKLEAAVTPR